MNLAATIVIPGGIDEIFWEQAIRQVTEIQNWNIEYQIVLRLLKASERGFQKPISH